MASPMRAKLILVAGVMLSGLSSSVAAQGPLDVAACEPAALAGSELLGVVLFDENDETLGRSQRAALQALLQSATASGFVRLLLVGHTDEAGSEENNLALARRRALAAQSVLSQTANGITLAPMSCGESMPTINVQGRRHPHNRRVELRGVR